ncbi:hypothetical protein CDAR_620091 [Caerostris darwini]|uniref:Uncharacterized protein n=1 Tax=Caerostris darwini TaxID=1538125 RepID=A0AAV4TNH1_9ARAC|nr:hypothetical protein CDAR_620091 [Caerostris darwini]
MSTTMDFLVTFVSFLKIENHRNMENKDNTFVKWLCLAVTFIASPFYFIKICTLIMAVSILDFIIFGFTTEKNNRPTSSKKIQIVIIDCEKLNIDEMLLYPTTEQYELSYPILEPTVNSNAYNSQTTHHEYIPTVTIEMQKPTIDQLICYPTVEQYYFDDNILKPNICNKTCNSFIRKEICNPPTEANPTVFIWFGKPY